MPDWTVSEEMQKVKACEHENARPTRATKSNGVVCVYLQCRDCGEKIKEVSKRDYNVNILPAFDEGLRRFHREKASEQHKEIVDRYLGELEQERTNQDAAFWRAYSAYLKSDHWRRLRAAVIKRDKFLCQNCFDPVAITSAHVHHQSYVGFQRLGYSFAFECVTLCRECHDTFHGGLDKRG